MLNTLKRLPLHPYLFAIYFVLNLVAINLGNFNAWMAVRSFLFFILVITILYWPLRWLTRSPHKAALILTLFLAVFFSFSQLHHLTDSLHLPGINLGQYRNWIRLIALGLVVFWIVRIRRNLTWITQAFNLVLIIALCFPVYQIIRFEIQSEINRRNQEEAQKTNTVSTSNDLTLMAGQTPPDIYYVILDTYGRSDTLRTYFQFDNSTFIQQLEKMGFYVAPCSQSNYASTELSLSSSLNLNYLDILGHNSDHIYSQQELDRLLQNNIVRQQLKNAGYRIVALDSGFDPTDWKDADVHLSMESDPLRSYLLGGVNAFEALEFQTSAGLLLYNAKPHLPAKVQSFLDAAYTEHRERILFAFDTLETLPKMPGPKFVFVHILAPHSPFVFGANGEIVGRHTPFTLNNDLEIADPQAYIEGYRNQVQYINRRTLQAMQAILASSKTPPIIIIQGDHGPKAGITTQVGRMTILDAYYFPGGNDGLYSTITPVNSFRIIFNRYFGGQFQLLPDLSYFSTNKTPDVFTVISSDAANCTP